MPARSPATARASRSASSGADAGYREPRRIEGRGVMTDNGHRDVIRDDGPQSFRWRLLGGPPLPIIQALPFGEAVRSTIYRAADASGLFPLPDAFHRGHNEEHSHAFWLPEDAD